MKQKPLTRVVIYSAALIILLSVLLPFTWLFISSITTNQELSSFPPHWIPHEPTFERYATVIFGKDVSFRGSSLSGPSKMFTKAMLNSLVIASVVTALSIFFGMLAAYAFSQFKFRFRDKLFLLTICVQMLPAMAIIIPMYMFFKTLNFTNTYFNLILLYTAGSVTYVIWVMVGFFSRTPKELEESARIDGCTRLGAFFKIILPISVPGLVATGTLIFLQIWNEFLFALVFTKGDYGKTISLAIGEFSTQFSIDYGMMSTGGVLTALPPIILAFMFQKYIVQGLTNGAVKG
ncbi:carbohydrate ABC transporter permease [Paenibacillus frigoriresistens]|uniref:carbohydrate ABC transporter permease n=1 Tax=Paenibacillus alginolyticus TaxID=59839 RepID=UPI001566462F|nr:carbohydrate ABC transporter permease [Paenibacillus frigoriresistens]NRF90382.1 carbohydrate ABC transporter permease [Paenibacillus frigoriresistens]